jgi:hypothetical protein
MSKRNFEKLLLEAVDEGQSSSGESSKQSARELNPFPKTRLLLMLPNPCLKVLAKLFTFLICAEIMWLRKNRVKA